MKKRKLDPKIIRVGDIVRIDKPEEFIRCGYPLCIKDMKKEIDELYREEILKGVQKLIEMVKDSDRKSIKIIGLVGTQKTNSREEVVYQKILRELAVVRLMDKKFGGNERKIFTEENKSLKNTIAEVVDIKIHRTGNRVSSSSGGYDYNGYYDYEPPYLESMKTHKILVLDSSRVSSKPQCLIVKYMYSYESYLKTEASNVTKLYSRGEIDGIELSRLYQRNKN